ncbi:hypothetical protein BgiMline_004488, partial [Biomphalaria glabrata]
GNSWGLIKGRNGYIWQEVQTRSRQQNDLFTKDGMLSSKSARLQGSNPTSQKP